MSGHVQVELWFHEYKLDALASVLEKQDTSVEERMKEMLVGLYVDMVPTETRQEIRTRIDAEHAAERAAEEAARKYTAFRVRENGVEAFFGWVRKSVCWTSGNSCAGICWRARDQLSPRFKPPSPDWSRSPLNSTAR